MKNMILDHTWRTGQPLLIGYLPAFYPDIRSYKRVLECCAEQGLVFLEIGVPCNDPYLDGEVIKEAMAQVNVPSSERLTIVHDSITEVRASGIQGIVMLYDETLSEIGVKTFADTCKSAEAVAVLVPNITEKNRDLLYAQLKDSSVEIVSFVGFGKSDEEIIKIMEHTTGFIYLQSIEGSTGGKFKATPEAKRRLDSVKSLAGPFNLPVALGFGISTLEDAEEAAEIGADAVIIGTAFLKKTAAGIDHLENYLKSFSPYLKKEEPAWSI